MGNFEPLSRKPAETGGYFWCVWADWGLVAKFGLALLGAITLFASVQFYFEDGNQRESFAVATASLANLPIERPLRQRQAKLLKQGSSYSWRAILWVQ